MFMALLKTMRPKQWTKNVVVFAALVFDRKVTHFDLLWQTVLSFGLLCLLGVPVTYFITTRRVLGPPLAAVAAV